MNNSEKIAEKYKALFDFSSKFIEKDIDLVTCQVTDSLDRHIILFHFVKACNLMLAIHTLSINGLATEGKIILRSFFNLLVNLKWLAENDDVNRFEKFKDFEEIYKCSNIKTACEHYDGWSDQEKDKRIKECKEKRKRIKEKYNLKTDPSQTSWSGKKISEMAIDVGLGYFYRLLYKPLSSSEHTGPDTALDYFDDSNNEETIIKFGAREDNIESVMLKAIGIFFSVKESVFKYLGIELERLCKDSERYQCLLTAYRN
ncbi:MAG: DUF5677 domain-containing protein [Pseudomonadota bacterium]